MVALDTATQPRLGEAVNALFAGKDMPVVNIDHHISNPQYGDHNLIDSTSPATGQIVYELLKNHDIDVPAEAMDHLCSRIPVPVMEGGNWMQVGYGPARNVVDLAQTQ